MSSVTALCRFIPVNKIGQAFRVSAVMKPSTGAGEDPFVRVKYLITDVITRLQARSSSETAVKCCCDEEMAKSAMKKEDVEAEVLKHSSVELNSFKRETAISRSSGMDGDVAEPHADLGDRLHQLNIDPMRVDEAMQQTASTRQPHNDTNRGSAEKQERRGQETERERMNEEVRKEGERTGEGVKNRE